MKIIIYQIDSKHCEGCKSQHGTSCLNKFMSLKRIDEYLSFDNCYKEVYCYEDNIRSLEEVFLKFNMNRPSDFTGHSLSVSDIVRVDDKLYYCDSVGFKEINKEFKRV